jgi:hypothetical protein
MDLKEPVTPPLENSEAKQKFVTLRNDIKNFISDFQLIHGHEKMHEYESDAIKGLNEIIGIIEGMLQPANDESSFSDTRYQSLVGKITNLLPPVSLQSNGFWGIGAYSVTMHLHEPMKLFVQALMRKEAERHLKEISTHVSRFEQRLIKAESETAALRSELDSTNNQLLSAQGHAKIMLLELHNSHPGKAATYAKSLNIEFQPLTASAAAAAASAPIYSTNNGLHTQFKNKEALPSKYQVRNVAQEKRDKNTWTNDDRKEYDKFKLKKFLSDVMFATICECVDFYHAHNDKRLKLLAKKAIDYLLENYDKSWATNMNQLADNILDGIELPQEAHELISTLQELRIYIDKVPEKARDIAPGMLCTLYFDGSFIPQDRKLSEQYKTQVTSSPSKKM